MIRLVLGLPAYGGRIVMQQSRMWLSLGAALADNREQFTLRALTLHDLCGVDVVRNKIVLEAIEAAHDAGDKEDFHGDGAWLLMVDADTFYDKDLEGGYHLLSMIKEGERRGAGVIAAPVPARRPDRPFMVYAEDPEGQVLADGSRKMKGVRPEHWRKGAPDSTERVVEVDAIATALFALNLRAVLSCPPPWFDFHYLKSGSLDTIGEDLDFCRKLKARGWKIYVDGRLEASHVTHGEVLGPTEPVNPSPSPLAVAGQATR